MSLINQIKVGDLMEYMYSSGIDVIKELNDIEPFIVTDLVMIGNHCSYDEAIKLVECELKSKSIEDMVDDIVGVLIPDIKCSDENSVPVDDDFSYLDVLEMFFEQLQIVDNSLSVSDFKDMNIRHMYRYAEGLNKRFINNINISLQSNYMNISMLMSALAGELSECPRLDDNGELHQKTLIEKLNQLKGR